LDKRPNEPTDKNGLRHRFSKKREITAPIAFFLSLGRTVAYS
jgi:hypothetical protein